MHNHLSIRQLSVVALQWTGKHQAIHCLTCLHSLVNFRNDISESYAVMYVNQSFMTQDWGLSVRIYSIMQAYLITNTSALEPSPTMTCGLEAVAGCNKKAFQ